MTISVLDELNRHATPIEAVIEVVLSERHIEDEEARQTLRDSLIELSDGADFNIYELERCALYFEAGYNAALKAAR